MTDTVESLVLWEEATGRGLVETVLAGGQLRVRATVTGLTLLERRRLEAYRRLIGRIGP